jgi:hypothetical protein
MKLPPNFRHLFQWDKPIYGLRPAYQCADIFAY